MHSMESIDILAMGDCDLSVGNSSPCGGGLFPRGGAFLGLDFPGVSPAGFHRASDDFGGAAC
jgi:hypothetical protein